MLDVVLLLLLVFMYRKMAISMAFHEIGGLALFALFVVHHLFNGKWSVAVTKRFFLKETPIRTRVQYVLSILLFIDFLLILLSGVLMSKVVFSFKVHGGAWKTIHYFCAALAVLLCGVHGGLHGKYLFGKLLKKKPLKICLSLLLACTLAFGVYSLTTTSFLQWLGMPFTASVSQGQGRGQGGPGYGNGNGNGNGHNQAEMEIDEAMPTLPEDQTQGTRPERPNQGNGSLSGGQRQGGIGQILLLVANYLSITALFGAATAALEWVIRRRGDKKQLRLET